MRADPGRRFLNNPTKLGGYVENLFELDTLEIDRFMGDMERFGMKPSVTMEAQGFDE